MKDILFFEMECGEELSGREIGIIEKSFGKEFVKERIVVGDCDVIVVGRGDEEFSNVCRGVEDGVVNWWDEIRV